MGFGHRVYKNYDPRAKIIKRMADEVFEVTGRNPLLDIALELERIALEDEYFVKRKLYPNVDFYSGLIYQAMGFPVDMFPVLFAIPRTPGWLAQWEEMLEDKEQKIARPRQVYLGRGAPRLRAARVARLTVKGLYLGKQADAAGQALGPPVELNPADLLTHGVIVGMTGSGKTGPGRRWLIEELLRQGVPVIAIDPKGDLGNLLLLFKSLEAQSSRPGSTRRPRAAKARAWTRPPPRRRPRVD